MLQPIKGCLQGSLRVEQWFPWHVAPQKKVRCPHFIPWVGIDSLGIRDSSLPLHVLNKFMFDEDTSCQAKQFF